MIISKKKLERLVEEEVCKRMAAIEDRRSREERYNRIVCRVDGLEAKFYDLDMKIRALREDCKHKEIRA